MPVKYIERKPQHVCEGKTRRYKSGWAGMKWNRQRAIANVHPAILEFFETAAERDGMSLANALAVALTKHALNASEDQEWRGGQPIFDHDLTWELNRMLENNHRKRHYNND